MKSDSNSIDGFTWWRRLKQMKNILRYLIICGFICSVCLLVLVLYLKSKPLPPPDIGASSMIYDDQNKLMDRIDNGELREPVPLSKIPKALVEATLAVEDQNFYHHFGFSIKGIIRAAWANIKAGRVTQGASTITQQLARNLYLTHDRTWSRKIKEALLTIQLELHYSKQEILEMYLNKIYYGNGAYGVNRASQVYFQQPVEKLNLSQCAFLVGIPRGPAYYSPYDHYQRAKARQHIILNLMAQNHMITKQEAYKASIGKLAIHSPTKLETQRANYFRDYIIRTAVDQFGLDESWVRSGGLKIYTTLNQKMQKDAEKAVTTTLLNHPDLQGALLSVDPRTGQIKAMVGGRDYQSSPYNRVFAHRQPGSSFKPILYLSALEHGFTPITKIMSQPTSFPYGNSVYHPSNYQQNYANKPITLREAIAKSDNIYAVTTEFQIGIDKEIEMAKRLGIRSNLSATPSLALGSYPVTPFEMTGAYTAFAANGNRQELFGIRKIVASDGTIIVSNEPKSTTVTTPANAFLMTNLLRSVFQSGGTGHRVKQMFSGAIAGKTGTTDRDGWLIGYNPNLLTTVWVGYDKRKDLPHDKARLSQYIWGKYMRQVASYQPLGMFSIPAGVKSVYIDEKSGYLANENCPSQKMEYFAEGTEPTIPCPVQEQGQNPPASSASPSLVDQIAKWLGF
ncbi:PBP1A family penicillin-binding protein [Shimazuella sp. AN120528]|uniref:transglycosylase domain-containing protein n=1 Tax=Shimazuella soli TaxID=1892854 RepID=UPI001F0EAD22|nr:PBP1A family penicillin-binding protein [Shimazuella soli]MCH5585086.1 PBP1A family penicillin-binding protein [Shimazuella soli]